MARRASLAPIGSSGYLFLMAPKEAAAVGDSPFAPGAGPVEDCTLLASKCPRCGARHSAGVTLMPTGNLQVASLQNSELMSGDQPLLRISESKAVHVAVAKFIHTSISLNLRSASDTSRLYAHGVCATSLASVDVCASPVLCEPARERMSSLPGGDVGRRRVAVPMLTPDDCERLHVFWACVLRATRLDCPGVIIPPAPESRRLPRIGFARVEEDGACWLLESFKLKKVTDFYSHACTDCVQEIPPAVESQTASGSCNGSTKGERIFLTTAVMDGVASAPAICANGDCGSELSNHLRHRYCPDHFRYHWSCGVRAGPGMDVPCSATVADATYAANRALLNPESCLRDEKLPFRVTCEAHEHVEDAWRRADKPDTESFLVSLREAGRRGRKRKRSGLGEDRRTNPLRSDHCKEGYAATAAQVSEANINDSSGEYKIRFTRRFGACFIVLARPCGFGLHATVASSAESPTAVVEACDACFGIGGLCKPCVLQYDAACRVTRSLYNLAGVLSGKLGGWRRTLWIVPPMHFKSHKESDKFCRATADPSLFSELFGPDGSLRFNGTACEQMFARLSRLESTLKSMRLSRAELLFYSAIEENNQRLIKLHRFLGGGVHLPTGERRDGNPGRKLSLTGGQ